MVRDACPEVGQDVDVNVKALSAMAEYNVNEDGPITDGIREKDVTRVVLFECKGKGALPRNGRAAAQHDRIAPGRGIRCTEPRFLDMRHGPRRKKDPV